MEQRFCSKIDTNGSGGCWNWTGCIGDDGYGRFSIAKKVLLTHRVAYKLWVGEIPDGLIVRHKCKQNRKCVNPDHLETGTKQDNSYDRVRDGTMFMGVNHSQAKLNDNSVREIRRLYADGNITQKELGKQFSISSSMIGLIIHKRKWTHIT